MSYLPHVQQTLFIGTSATDMGFQIAKASTQFGFSFSRKIISTVFDTLAGSPPLVSVRAPESEEGTSTNILSSTINAGISFAERCALQGISLGEQISKTSLDLAFTTVSRLDGFYKTHLSDQYTTFKALKLFVKMVRKQWRDEPDHDPPGGISQFGLLDILKAISCWALLQNLTSAIYSRRIMGELEEIELDSDFATQQQATDLSDERLGFVVVDRETEAERGSEIITGELIHPSQIPSNDSIPPQTSLTPDQQTLQNFKSYAGLCSSSYGGVGYLMFGGVSAKSTPQPVTETDAPIEVGEKSVNNQDETPKEDESVHVPGSLPISDDSTESDSRGKTGEGSASTQPGYSTWNLLTGKHDRELLEHFGELHEESKEPIDNEDIISETGTIDWYEGDAEPTESKVSDPLPTKPHRPSSRQAPRYFILTDHIKKKVILCLRGTFSLDDLATDLTCEYEFFEPASYWDTPYPDMSSAEQTRASFKIHSGFAEVAEMIGNSKTGALHKTLSKVLRQRSGYTLDLVGHSLGAGVAAILALMWAELSSLIHREQFFRGAEVLRCVCSSSPRTTQTTRKGGLPSGIPVKVYGMAPPCSVSATLSDLSRDMISSFVYSTDAISRLSLGHILDLKTVSAWICHSEALAHTKVFEPSSEPDSQSPKESGGGIWEKVIKYYRMKNQTLQKMGATEDKNVQEKEMEELEQWLISARKTLEANLVHAELFPPGTTYWYLPVGSDLKFPSPLHSESKQNEENLLRDESWTNKKGRLLKVTGQVEKVFGQMIFSKEMLSCHLPHNYLKVIQNEI
ncbi:hypothetical protein CROQUDRAFT_76005 [Cronartium quercuum f. sp. fusiforme G11]|uniref:sn-1-specific diacylglycerol lipase n=1 Tax=Cronartium quercuum f. sp. fusiforme G11 TaxID=708437 RepID=A0A9P6NJ24_9BASI|nr:hypothetical protein CROQUDRAFT_76005 [Cronartium quercuum f. sp. fusiforme G11]